MTLETCQVLAQTIRLVPSPTLRQDAVREVLSEHPDAPWLRHFVGQLWREDCDEMWTRAAIDAAPFGSAVCAIKDEIDAAREFGIDIPLRWSRENLTEIVRNRALLDFDGRPIAAIVYAEADYNGAFGEHNAMVEALIQNGYCVMYFDESTDTGVLRALRTATTRPSSPKSEPAALIVLGAHSSKTDMVFGRKGEGENRLSVEDKDIIVESLVKDTLRENGQIVLIACSAGEGREKEDNVANLFRGVFSHAKAQGIWSTEVPDNIGSWKFDPATHELTDVRFLRGKVYRP